MIIIDNQSKIGKNRNLIKIDEIIHKRQVKKNQKITPELKT